MKVHLHIWYPLMVSKIPLYSDGKMVKSCLSDCGEAAENRPTPHLTADTRSHSVPPVNMWTFCMVSFQPRKFAPLNLEWGSNRRPCVAVPSCWNCRLGWRCTSSIRMDVGHRVPPVRSAVVGDRAIGLSCSVVLIQEFAACLTCRCERDGECGEEGNE